LGQFHPKETRYRATSQRTYGYTLAKQLTKKKFIKDASETEAEMVQLHDKDKKKMMMYLNKQEMK